MTIYKIHKIISNIIFTIVIPMAILPTTYAADDAYLAKITNHTQKRILTLWTANGCKKKGTFSSFRTLCYYSIIRPQQTVQHRFRKGTQPWKILIPPHNTSPYIVLKNKILCPPSWTYDAPHHVCKTLVAHHVLIPHTNQWKQVTK